MPVYYSNTQAGPDAQTDRIWEAPQDWSQHGPETLVLHFYGSEGNTGQLYVKINDTKILYEGNASDLVTPQWHSWSIDLSSLDVSSVTTLSIGIEGVDATGMFLLDSVFVLVLRCGRTI